MKRFTTIATLGFAALLPVSGAAQISWDTPDGDWYDAASWSPATVPTFADDAEINNGGTARADALTAPDTFFPGFPDALEANVLDVGTDGGSGSLVIRDPKFLILDLLIESELNVGRVRTGAADSTGEIVWEVGNGDIVGPFFAPSEAAIGATDTAGNATGTVIQSGGVIVDFDDVLIGHSTGAGTAIGSVVTGGIFGAGAGDLAVGVSTGAGNATGSVTDSDIGFNLGIDSFDNVDVGRADGTGDASGTVALRDDLGLFGTFGGNLNVGVSTGTGGATGSVRTEFDVLDFLEVNVGLSSGGGTADGTLRLEQDSGFFATFLEADDVTAGVGAGATGRVELVQALADVTNALTLGAGATLALGLHGTDRAGGVAFDNTYSAVDAFSASLDPAGTVGIADFHFVPTAGTHVFDLIVTDPGGGITGDFAAGGFTVENLNQGFTVSANGIVGGDTYQLEITGLGPSFSSWTDPAVAGPGRDWFDPANWSSPLIPSLGDPAAIDNGGVAEATAASAAGRDMQAFELTVGGDAGDGGLTAVDVNLDVRRELSMGRITTGAADTSGTVDLTGADVHVGGIPDPDVGNTGLRVGINEGGTGTGTGLLTMTGGNLTVDRQLEIGRADDDAVAGQSGEARGTVVFAGAGIGASTVDIGDDVDVGEAFTDSSTSTATAVGSLTVTDATVRIRGDFEIGEVPEENDGTASADGTVLLERVDLRVDGVIDMADADTETGGDATGRGDFTLRDATAAVGGDFRVGDVDAAADPGETSAADGRGTVLVEASSLAIGDDLFVGRADATGDATVVSRAEVTFRDATVTVFDELEIADGSADDPGSSVDVEGRLVLEGSDLEVMHMIEVGELTGDSTGANVARGFLHATDSEIRAEELEVAFGDPDLGTLEGEVRLTRSSVILTDMADDPADLETLTAGEGLLDLHEGSRLVFDVDGLVRGDGYGAIDAVQALLDGTLDVVFNIALARGWYDFDLIRAGADPAVTLSGASPGISGGFDSLGVLGLDPGTFAFSLVSETSGGIDYDIFRLSVHVPEPASAALLLLGLAGLARRRSRRPHVNPRR